MKMSVWFVAAFILAFGGSSRAQDNKSDQKLNVGALEKAFGIKMKSVVVNEPKPVQERIQIHEDKAAAKTDIVITFEFTKDLTELKVLAWLNDTFVASRGIPYRFDQLPLIFHLFDEDNVCIDKIIIASIEGDLSGVKGDAFRIVLSCSAETFKRAKKIEARHYLLPPR